MSQKKWNVIITDPNDLKENCSIHTIKFCGPPASICPECKADGYTGSSGIGDGKTRIYKDGDLIDEYRTY